MERETKKITTPIDKHEVEILAWLTGGEKRKITNFLLNNQSLEMAGAAQNFKIDSEIINKSQDTAFETIIVNINGVKENVVQNVLDMKSKDFDFVVKEINKVTNAGT